MTTRSTRRLSPRNKAMVFGPASSRSSVKTLPAASSSPPGFVPSEPPRTRRQLHVPRISPLLSFVAATNLPESPSSAPTSRGRSYRRCTRPAGTPLGELTGSLLKFPSAHRIHRLVRPAAVAFHVISQQCPPPTEGRRSGKAPKSLAVTRWWTRGVLPPSHADPPSHNPSADSWRNDPAGQSGIQHCSACQPRALLPGPNVDAGRRARTFARAWCC